MYDRQFERLVREIGDLTPIQFKQLVQAYAGTSGQDAGRAWSEAVYSVSEQHLADLGINRSCPGCGSVAVVNNGVNGAGIQRLQCADCGTNFTHFTDTLRKNKQGRIVSRQCALLPSYSSACSCPRI